MDIVESDRNTAVKYFANRGICLNHKVDANEVSSFLQEAGPIDSEQIVSLAKSRSCPLHKYFEWDDAIAGHAYRLTQARHLVLSIQIESVDTGEITRAFESVTIDNRRAYVPIQTIVQSEELVGQVIENALRQLRYWSAKHQKLKKLFGGVFDEIKKAEEKWRKNEKINKGRRPRGKVLTAGRSANKKVAGKDNNRRRLPAAGKQIQRKI